MQRWLLQQTWYDAVVKGLSQKLIDSSMTKDRRYPEMVCNLFSWYFQSLEIPEPISAAVILVVNAIQSYHKTLGGVHKTMVSSGLTMATDSSAKARPDKRILNRHLIMVQQRPNWWQATAPPGPSTRGAAADSWDHCSKSSIRKVKHTLPNKSTAK